MCISTYFKRGTTHKLREVLAITRQYGQVNTVLVLSSILSGIAGG